MHERLLWYISTVLRRLAMLGLVGVFLLAPGMNAWADPRVLGADRAYALAQGGQRLLIDVRTPGEWRQTGLPAAAVEVSLHHEDGLEGFVRSVLAAVDGDRAAPIALICRTGNRSRLAHELLIAHGFTDVLDVSEGVMGGQNGPGWMARGLPMEACTLC